MWRHGFAACVRVSVCPPVGVGGFAAPCVGAVPDSGAAVARPALFAAQMLHDYNHREYTPDFTNPAKINAYSKHGPYRTDAALERK